MLRCYSILLILCNLFLISVEFHPRRRPGPTGSGLVIWWPILIMIVNLRTRILEVIQQFVRQGRHRNGFCCTNTVR